MAAATYLYARVLEIKPPGAALAAVSFCLCGFQAVHAPHEPFYHLMPYLPLCLYLADRYATTGRWIFMAALALAWGVQLTLGHFQIQMWTGCLALVTGSWRAVAATRGRKPTLFLRILGLLVGLAWGAAIAVVQLKLTWELTRFSSFFRPAHFLAAYLFPISHWAQFALPEVFQGRPGGAGDAYWGAHQTISGEACAYIGVVPLMFACVGWVAFRRDRALAPWRVILLAAFALATMAEWWPDAFFVLLKLPGIGWFRAPARYTLLTSFGLVLLAGRGFDHAIAARRFWLGLTVAILFATVASAWSIRLAGTVDFRAGMGANTLPIRFAAAGGVWILGLLAVAGWRSRAVGAWAPLSITILELGILFSSGPIAWRRSIHLPEESPVLQKLATLPNTGLIAGRLQNLPVDAGRPTSYPYLGISPPSPNYLLEASTVPPGQNTLADRIWQRRFGVTHGVWSERDQIVGSVVIASIVDPILDEVMSNVPSLRQGGRLGPWKIVREVDPFPAIWLSSQVHEAPTWDKLYTKLVTSSILDEAWFLTEDNPPTLPEPTMRHGRVLDWDGRTAVVEHDGSCILVMRRTYYPGWFYQIDDAPERPMLKVNAGLHGVALAGPGTSRVSVRYRPTGLTQAAIISLTAAAAALIVIATHEFKARIGRRAVASDRIAESRCDAMRCNPPG